MDLSELTSSLDQQQKLLIEVATHEAKIDSVQNDYAVRRRAIATELKRRGLKDPNPFGDLWEWYEYWKEHLPTYASRRAHVRSLYRSLRDAIDNLPEREIGSRLIEEPTGWIRVDEQVAQLREKCATARTVDDYKGIGHLSREIFVSLAEACFAAEKHWPEGADQPSGVKERLDAVIKTQAGGSSNKELRKTLKATIDLANKVQHDQTASLDAAMIVGEATLSGVNLMRLLVEGASEIGEEEVQPDEDWLARLLENR